VELLYEVFGQIIGIAISAGSTPWARLIDRDRPGIRPGLSWTTRAAAVVVVAETLPVLLFLFFVARMFVGLATDDMLLFVGLILFLPIAAVTAALGVAIAGLAALGSLGLLEGDSTARWMTVLGSTVGVVFGAAVSLLHPPTLGYVIGAVCALEVVLLVLPATAVDFGPRPAATPTVSEPSSPPPSSPPPA